MGSKVALRVMGLKEILRKLFHDIDNLTTLWRLSTNLP